MAAPTVSLVVPAFNEERRLPDFLEVIQERAADEIGRAGLELVEVVIVDDGSVDRTAEILRVRAPSLPWLRPVLRGGLNRGKGAAVGAGVREARGELVLLTDVDLSTPLTEVTKLYPPLAAGADIVIGSRSLDRSIVERSLHREVLGRAYNLMVRLLFRLPYRDTQCGFKLLPTALARMLVEVQLIERYSFDVETLVRARAMGLSVVEVPVVWLQNDDSRVNVWRTSPRMAWETLSLRWTLRGLRPGSLAPVARLPDGEPGQVSAHAGPASTAVTRL
jgi:dolichyl-phosphate beta-glucosyltransferase